MKLKDFLTNEIYPLLNEDGRLGTYRFDDNYDFIVNSKSDFLILVNSFRDYMRFHSNGINFSLGLHLNRDINEYISEAKSENRVSYATYFYNFYNYYLSVKRTVKINEFLQC